jgi:drug/metabolite transporter (DMT)-like permease
MAAVGFGALPVLARISYRSGADVVTLLALRFLAAASLLLPWILLRRRAPLPGGFLVRVALLAVVGYAVPAFGYFTAIRFADVTVVAPLIYTSPVWVVLLTLLLGSEGLTARKLTAAAAGLAGAVMVVGLGGRAEAAGVGLALGAAALFGLYIVLAHRYIQPRQSEVATAIVVSVVALVYCSLALVLRDFHPPGTYQGWVALGASAVATAIANILFFEGLERISPVTASAVLSVDPVTAAALAVLWLGETVSLGQAVGFVLVILAVFLARSAMSSRPTAEEVRPGPQ